MKITVWDVLSAYLIYGVLLVIADVCDYVCQRSWRRWHGGKRWI